MAVAKRNRFWNKGSESHIKVHSIFFLIPKYTIDFPLPQNNPTYDLWGKLY